ncbi:TerD family protein [Streptomyces sp. CAU 1734]|uniref:TerD family protein n=1 Tax=Streptomyces sp. CAU 1734 TaxID=3140360 RepID=UPI0032613FC1
MTHIVKGANTPVPSTLLRVAVGRSTAPGTPAVDASALLLDARGTVRGDADLVFYNQPRHPSGAVRHAGVAEGGGQRAEWLEVELPLLEAEVQRVLIAASCDGGVFGSVPGLYTQALGPDGAPVVHFAVTDATTETAFVLGEFYRRAGGWKFRAVGQGYASGLAGLATDFGITVAEEPQAPAPPPAPAPAPVPVPYAAPAPVPAAPLPRIPQLAYTPPPPAPFPAHAPAPPAPVHRTQVTDHFSGFTGFSSVTRRGRGKGIVRFDEPLPTGQWVIVEAWHRGEGYFGVHTLDERHQQAGLLFSSVVRDFRGRTLEVVPAGRPLTLSVDAEDEWTAVVHPLPSIRRLGSRDVSSANSDVIAYTGPAAGLEVTYEGDEYREGRMTINVLPFFTDVATGQVEPSELLFAAVPPFRQTLPVPEGPLVLCVEADGPWTARLRPPAV